MFASLRTVLHINNSLSGRIAALLLLMYISNMIHISYSVDVALLRFFSVATVCIGKILHRQQLASTYVHINKLYGG